MSITATSTCLFLSNIYNLVHTFGVLLQSMFDYRLANLSLEDTLSSWILAGDFNQHYLLWSSDELLQLARKQANASMLVDAISDLALTIFTKKGATTRKGCTGENDFTLNLLLSS